MQRFDLIFLSLHESLKNGFASKSVKAQTYMLILCYSTHTRLLVLETCCILVFLTPITFSLSRHMYDFGLLSTCSILACSTSTVTQHLYITQHLYHARHLKSLDTYRNFGLTHTVARHI